LFAGLRPFEASRLDWSAVNLADKEIRLEAMQTKTGRARVVTVDNTLLAWLKAYKGKPFFPSNWRKAFDRVKLAAGFGTPEDEQSKLKPWPVDVLRHTAISNYFRHTGSYGQTAEQFGNSEAIIKNHYQGRVTSEETKKFYVLRPTKGASK
jgi:integrase